MIKTYMIFLKDIVYLSYRYEKNMYRTSTYILDKVICPLLYICFFYLLLRFVYDSTNILIYLIGNTILVSTSVCFNGLSQVIAREKALGTIIYIEACSYNSIIIYFFKSIYYLIESFIKFIFLLALSLTLTQTTLDFQILIKLIFITLIINMTCLSFGLIIGIIGIFVRDINYLSNLFYSFFMLICGINFSITLLPKFIQSISMFTPLTKGINAINNVINLKSPMLNICEMIMLIILYLLIFTIAYKIVKKISQKYNKLDIF